MTEYNTLNVKLSTSQLNKLKSDIKNSAEVTLRLSSNIIGNPNDAIDFPHRLFLTNTQVLKLRKAIANNPSSNTKLTKFSHIK